MSMQTIHELQPWGIAITRPVREDVAVDVDDRGIVLRIGHDSFAPLSNAAALHLAGLLTAAANRVEAAP